MDINFWLIEILIVILSLIMNWFVQLSYYLWRKHKDRLAFAGQKTLLNYYTGVIGDGVIVPVINVLIYYIIYNLSQIRGTGETGVIGGNNGLFYAFMAGLTLDFLAHYFQGKLKLTNWSMPKPFHWNFAGYWHMVSFPFQMGYLVLFFWLIGTNWSNLLSGSGTVLATIGVWCLMALFVVLYCLDNKWI